MERDKSSFALKRQTNQEIRNIDFCTPCDIFNKGTNQCMLLDSDRQALRVNAGSCPEAVQSRVEGTMTLLSFKPNQPISPVVLESVPQGKALTAQSIVPFGEEFH